MTELIWLREICFQSAELCLKQDTKPDTKIGLCEICNSSYCFLPWTNSLGGEGKKQKKERGGKKLKCLVLSQAYSCFSEQQNLQVFPFSVTSFQNKIYRNTFHVQRSPLADLHRQVTTSQLLLPILKIGKISALQGRIWRSKHKHNSRSPDKMRLTIYVWERENTFLCPKLRPDLLNRDSNAVNTYIPCFWMQRCWLSFKTSLSSQ